MHAGLISAPYTTNPRGKGGGASQHVWIIVMKNYEPNMTSVTPIILKYSRHRLWDLWRSGCPLTECHVYLVRRVGVAVLVNGRVDYI